MIANLKSGTKNELLRVLGHVVRRPMGAWATRGFFQRRLNIFFYHGVWADDAPQLRLFSGVPLTRFAADLRMLQAYFHFVPLHELLRGGRRLVERDVAGKPLATLTFDDGFDLTKGGATAILDIPATVFVNSNSVNYETMMWQHQFSAIRAIRGDARFLWSLNVVLEKTGVPAVDKVSDQGFATRGWPPSRKDEYARAVWDACDMPPIDQVLAEHRPYFDWAGLQDWIGRGHGVGSHTRSHPFCSQLSESDIADEIVSPCAELRAKLGLAEVPFAYPFGDRLQPDLEDALARRGTCSCLLGTEGLTTRPADPNRADRVDAEGGVDREVFGRPVARFLRQRSA